MLVRGPRWLRNCGLAVFWLLKGGYIGFRVEGFFGTRILRLQDFRVWGFRVIGFRVWVFRVIIGFGV